MTITPVLHSRAAPSLDLLTQSNKIFLRISFKTVWPSFRIPSVKITTGCVVSYSCHTFWMVFNNFRFVPIQSRYDPFHTCHTTFFSITCSKIKKRRRSNVVVSCNRENKFKAVSNTVWVCWKAMI